MTEAELLFSEILNCDRLSLYSDRTRYLGKENSLLAASTLKKRIKGEPIQYILAKTEFMGLNFKVEPRVFIPRPETEILVETAMKKAHELASLRAGKLNILDLGTGSGCIAISLAKFLPNVRIIATDISRQALEIARYNVLLNKVNEKIIFMAGDLFAVNGKRQKAYDLIVSNPPYISSADIDNLQPEIRYEPRLALDGGRDGLDFYRRIISESPEYLKENGFLILEIGFNQRQEIANIFQSSENFAIIETVKDYNNIDRVMVAKRKKNNG